MGDLANPSEQTRPLHPRPRLSAPNTNAPEVRVLVDVGGVAVVREGAHWHVGEWWVEWQSVRVESRGVWGTHGRSGARDGYKWLLAWSYLGQGAQHAEILVDVVIVLDHTLALADSPPRAAPASVGGGGLALLGGILSHGSFYLRGRRLWRTGESDANGTGGEQPTATVDPSINGVIDGPTADVDNNQNPHVR